MPNHSRLVLLIPLILLASLFGSISYAAIAEWFPDDGGFDICSGATNKYCESTLIYDASTGNAPYWNALCNSDQDGGAKIYSPALFDFPKQTSGSYLAFMDVANVCTTPSIQTSNPNNREFFTGGMEWNMQAGGAGFYLSPLPLCQGSFCTPTQIWSNTGGLSTLVLGDYNVGFTNPAVKIGGATGWAYQNYYPFGKNTSTEQIRIQPNGGAFPTSWLDDLQVWGVPYIDPRSQSFVAKSGQSINLTGSLDWGPSCANPHFNDPDNDTNYSGETLTLAKTVSGADYNSIRVQYACDNTKRRFLYPFPITWEKNTLIPGGDFENCNTESDVCPDWTITIGTNCPTCDSSCVGPVQNYDKNALWAHGTGINDSYPWKSLYCPEGDKCFNATTSAWSKCNSVHAGVSMILEYDEEMNGGRLSWFHLADNTHTPGYGGSGAVIEFQHNGTNIVPVCSALPGETRWYRCHADLFTTNGKIRWIGRQTGVGDKASWVLDNIRWSLTFTDLVVQTNPSEIGENAPFDILADYTDSESAFISGADCNVVLRGQTHSMIESGGQYTYSNLGLGIGAHVADISCGKTGYETSTEQILIEIFDEEYINRFNNLVITDIENVSHVQNDANIIFTPTNDDYKVVYDINNPIYNYDLTVQQTILNANNDSTKEYYIYSGTEDEEGGSSFTFDTQEQWQAGTDINTTTAGGTLALVPTVNILSTIFDENFNDNNITRINLDWDIDQIYHWEVSEQRLKKKPGFAPMIYTLLHFVYEDYNSSDYTVQADMNFHSTNTKSFGLYARYTNEQNNVLCYYSPKNNLFGIKETISGTEQHRAVAILDYSGNTFDEMSLTVSGNIAICSYLGTNIVGSISNQNNGLAGLLAEYTRKGERQYDNFQIKESALEFPATGQWTSHILNVGDGREITFFNINETLLGAQDTNWEIRRGNSLVIDGTWTAFQPLTKNDAVSITNNGKYTQLRGNLIADANTTPIVDSIELNYEYEIGAQDYGFLSSLNYGFGSGDGIQRTWNNTLNSYEFTFEELFPVGFNRTYTLAWKEPMKAWPNLHNPDILSTNTIQTNYVDGRQIQTFNLSQYTNLDMRWVSDLPILLSLPDQEDRYVLRFTAFLDTNQTDLNIFIQDEDNLQQITITDQPHTYYVNIEGSLKIYTNLTSSDPARSLYWEKTSIDERGGFDKSIVLLNQYNQPLPIAISSSEGIYFPYLDEGQNFKAQSIIYDTHNKFDYYEIRTYIGSPSIENRIYTKKVCLIAECDTNNIQPAYSDPIIYSINEDLSGVVDTTPPTAFNTTTPNRLIKITIAAHDIISNEFEIVSDDIIMYQFPHLPTDLIFAAREYETQVGKNPYGEIILKLFNSDIVNAVHLTLEPLSFVPAIDQNYERVFVKDEYFECVFEDCGFDYFLEDYKFPQIGRYLLTASLDHKAEILNSDNPYTNYRLIIDTNKITIDLARLISPFERTPGILGVPLRQVFAFRNTEPLHFVLELRDEKHADLGNNYRPRLYLRDCGQADGIVGQCNGTDYESTREAVFFLPEGEHFYDEQTGINRWFYKHILYEDETIFLQNGHEYSIFVNVNDEQEMHGDVGEIALTKKGPLNFLDVFLSLVNGPNEYYLHINNTITLNPPDFRCMACTELDIEEGYNTAFEAPIECIGLYGISQQAPDQFQFRIGNQNSNYLEENPNLQQFIQVNIDWVDMVKRDRNFMFALLQTEYGPINYMWEYFKAYGIRTFGNQFFDEVSGASDLEQFFSAKGYDPTTNQVCDYNQALSTLPQNIDIFAFKISDFEVINQKNYTELENINPKDFLKRASQLEINIPITENRIDFYATATQPEKTYTKQNKLVINEEYSQTTNDVNATPDPRILNLTLTGDLLYNNSYLTDTIIVNMQYYVILLSNKPILSSIYEWFGELWTNPGKAAKNLLTFIFANLIWLVLIILAIVILGYARVVFFPAQPREGW